MTGPEKQGHHIQFISGRILFVTTKIENATNQHLKLIKAALSLLHSILNIHTLTLNQPAHDNNYED